MKLSRKECLELVAILSRLDKQGHYVPTHPISIRICEYLVDISEASKHGDGYWIHTVHQYGRDEMG